MRGKRNQLVPVFPSESIWIPPLMRARVVLDSWQTIRSEQDSCCLLVLEKNTELQRPTLNVEFAALQYASYMYVRILVGMQFQIPPGTDSGDDLDNL